MKQPAHSKIGASSMYRWAECPGSIALSDGIHAPTSRWAAEGTCAHNLADACIRAGLDPDIYLGAKRTADNQEFIVDEEMVEGVRLYIQAGLDVYDKEAGDILYSERRFDLSHLYPGLFGTNDRVIWKPQQRRLIVDDFKYGAGIAVEVKQNKQLMYYALGALHNLKLPVMEVWLRIIQPRCPHPDGPVRVHEMNAMDLFDFQGDLILAAQATQRKGAPLRAGSWCRFCPASAICPEHAKVAQQAAQMAFTVIPEHNPLAAPEPAIDYAKLGEALKMVDVVEAWAKNVREFAYAEAESGAKIPGWKLVDKRANRSWKDIVAAELRLKALGLGETQLYAEPVLRSPAQIEKVMGKKKFSEVEAELVEKKSSGHALAPDTDSRPAVTRQTAEDAFANA